MRVAVLADVHANLPALDAVLGRVDQLGADRLVVLGDLVGYNAEPVAVIDRIRERADAVVVGNHEVDVVKDRASANTRSAARAAQRWTREQLDDEHRAYLAALPAHLVDDSGLLLAHGCYLNNHYYSGYVTPTMYGENLAAIAGRSAGQVVALCGHTHIPFCVWTEGDGYHEAPVAEPVRWPARSAAVLANPGSVGQPRDGDTRACFALVDTQARRIEWHRVGYDVGAACRAILAAGLDPSLAERLREGR